MIFKINDPVTTPNGPGTVYGKQVVHGRMVIIVRHIVAEMTQVPMRGTLTVRAADQKTPERYPWGLWTYYENEVKHA